MYADINKLVWYIHLYKVTRVFLGTHWSPVKAGWQSMTDWGEMIHIFQPAFMCETKILSVITFNTKHVHLQQCYYKTVRYWTTLIEYFWQSQNICSREKKIIWKVWHRYQLPTEECNYFRGNHFFICSSTVQVLQSQVFHF